MSGTFIDKTLGVIPNDKQLHGLWMFFFTSVGLLIAPIIWVVGAGLFVIILKEVLDGKTNSNVEHFKDIIAGVVGLCLALAVNYIGVGI